MKCVYILILLAPLFASCNSSNTEASKETIYKPQADTPSVLETNLYYQFRNELSNKTLFIGTTYNGERRDMGAGFIVNKKGKLYLVTNYHIVPGTDFNDTTTIEHNHKNLPNKIEIGFHTKNFGLPIKTTYDLYDSKNRRLFYTCKPDNFLINNNKNPKSVIDLVFIPLGKLDSNILIDSMPMYDNIDFGTGLNGGEMVSVWGFRTGIVLKNLYCIIDTATVSKRPYYDMNDLTITLNIHKEFGGNSGSPVYFHKSGKAFFIGIESASTKQGNVIPKEFVDNSPNQQLAFVLIKELILYALNKSVP